MVFISTLICLLNSKKIHASIACLLQKNLTPKAVKEVVIEPSIG